MMSQIKESNFKEGSSPLSLSGLTTDAYRGIKFLRILVWFVCLFFYYFFTIRKKEKVHAKKVTANIFSAQIYSLLTKLYTNINFYIYCYLKSCWCPST